MDRKKSEEDRQQTLDMIEKDISTALQSAGHPHEGSSYASQKGFELVRFRLDCLRHHVNELDNLKHSRAGRVATASLTQPQQTPQELIPPQQAQAGQQIQSPLPQQQLNYQSQQLPIIGQAPPIMNPNPGILTRSPGQVPSGPISAGQLSSVSMNPSQLSGPGHMQGTPAPIQQQQQIYSQQQMNQQVPPQYMSPHGQGQYFGSS
ncbi:mediator of RNA polymerase II transcription subunit 11-like isoform X2 [Artemia franciscana]|uniref:Uncharacterized protein n=1 Tax=Artemia franciscana TaxID=6661 RepID=A0AA88L8M2_ARTSF|nr:hypothetical protein QYM36_011061 [Artemia franciscana]